jgi:hypothetical protein
MFRSSLLSAAWVVAMLTTTPTASLAQDERWQVGTAPSFSSGRFGTDTRTEVLHTATTARRLFDDGDMTLVFPVTCIWGNGAVTVINGTPVRKEQTSRTSDVSRPVRGTDDVSLRPGSGALPVETRNCGMGDIVVRGRYYLVDERGWKPTIAVRGHVKAPTASAERGLGTGRPDEGIGLEVSRTLVGGTLVMADGGYTIIGDADGVDFNNTWWYDIGIGQNLANGAVNVSVFFEEYRALVHGLVNARDVLAAVSVKGANRWRVQVAGQFGLTDGAPDRGLTIGASRRF